MLVVLTKGPINEKPFANDHQYGGDDVTCKPRIMYPNHPGAERVGTAFKLRYRKVNSPSCIHTNTHLYFSVFPKSFHAHSNT